MLKAITQYSMWLLFGAIFFSALPANAQTVFQSLKWNNRILVLHAPEGSSFMAEQLALFDGFLEDIEDRELVVLRLRLDIIEAVPNLSPFPFEARVLDNRQQRRYMESLFASDGLSGEELRVTLVGLDGDIKQSWDGVIEPSVIFNEIDAMPMRQRELQEELNQQ